MSTEKEEVQTIILKLTMPPVYGPPQVDSVKASIAEDEAFIACECHEKAGAGAGGNCACGTQLGGGKG